MIEVRKFSESFMQREFDIGSLFPRDKTDITSQRRVITDSLIALVKNHLMIEGYQPDENNTFVSILQILNGGELGLEIILCITVIQNTAFLIAARSIKTMWIWQ